MITWSLGASDAATTQQQSPVSVVVFGQADFERRAGGGETKDAQGSQGAQGGSAAQGGGSGGGGGGGQGGACVMLAAMGVPLSQGQDNGDAHAHTERTARMRRSNHPLRSSAPPLPPLLCRSAALYCWPRPGGRSHGSLGARPSIGRDALASAAITRAGQRSPRFCCPWSSRQSPKRQSCRRSLRSEGGSPTQRLRRAGEGR